MWDAADDEDEPAPQETNSWKLIAALVIFLAMVITVVACCLGVRMLADVFGMDPRLLR